VDFSVIKTRVANEVGLDTTTDATILGTWVNAAYKQVCGLYNWPWLLKHGTIQTVADRTTGTVSINSGSTSLTFSSAPTVSVANQYMIQFTATSDDWYLISSHTGSSTSATLSVPFVGSSNISGANYILRKVFYSMPSDLDRIIDVRQAITDTKLGAVDIRTFDAYLPDPTATGNPVYYSTVGMDTNKYWQITMYPTPTAIINLQIRYLQIPADLTSTDTPILPEKFHDILVFGALYLFGHPYIDDTRVREAQARYLDLLNEMKLMCNPTPDQLTVLQPWDTRPTRPHGRLMYPSNYPQYWGY